MINEQEQFSSTPLGEGGDTTAARLETQFNNPEVIELWEGRRLFNH